MTEIISWLALWFSSHCNGDWEHENQIKIETIDNPGWSVTIDLSNTDLDHLDIELQTSDLGDSDWFLYRVKEKKFFGAGDLSKLLFLLNKFKELVESNYKV